jgi:pimeloyl-ACP methyl ester carboxylesterase
VSRLYPVDPRRVFLVGHSMGAAQAMAAAGRQPERFAGVAALGGGGGVAPSKGLEALPFFIGVGSEDFLRPAALTLRDRLGKAGARKVVSREYPDVEHLLVVQAGLRDVFAFFDGAAKR